MNEHELSAAFYGVARIGKRGQIVIPAEARADLDINEGDRLFVLRHPQSNGVVLVKIDVLRDCF